MTCCIKWGVQKMLTSLHMLHEAWCNQLLLIVWERVTRSLLLPLPKGINEKCKVPHASSKRYTFDLAKAWLHGQDTTLNQSSLSVFLTLTALPAGVILR